MQYLFSNRALRRDLKMSMTIFPRTSVALVVLGVAIQASASYVTPSVHTEKTTDVRHTKKTADIRHTKPYRGRAEKKIAKKAHNTATGGQPHNPPTGGLNQAQIDAYRSVNQSIFNSYNDGGYKYQGWQFGR